MSKKTTDSLSTEYATKKGFFEYAYPEGDLSKEHKELYEAGYSHNLTKQLVGNLKTKLKAVKKIPDTTKIFVLDICQDNNLSNVLNDEINKQSFESIKKIVFILPLSIDSHQHSLVIHFESTQNGPIVHTIFKDPYGASSAFEGKKNTVINQVKTFAQGKPFAQSFCDKDITFKYKSDAIDLQGFNYDYSNCAPLTLYCLNQFLEHALRDLTPDEYKISLLFDLVAFPEINKSTHNAFILRLKLEQLKSVNEEYELGFQSAAGFGYRDKEKSDKAKTSINKLLGEILEKAKLKYSNEIDLTKHSKFNKLDEVKTMKLLNSISNYIVDTAVRNCINPMDLSVAINRIIENFDSDIEPRSIDERQSLRMMKDMFELYTTANPIFGIQPSPVGGIESELINVIKDLCERGAEASSVLGTVAINAENLEIFEILLATLTERKDYFDILTSLLQSTSHKYNKFVVHDLKHNIDIRHQILDSLLQKGADPFVKNISLFHGSSCVYTQSAMEIIAECEPSMVQIFLNHYPEKITPIYLEAIKSNNSELIDYLQSKFQENAFIHTPQQFKNVFFASLRGKNSNLIKYCIDQQRLNEEDLKKALSQMTSIERELLNHERRLQDPMCVDTKAFKKIRTEKPAITEIKEYIKNKLENFQAKELIEEPQSNDADEMFIPYGFIKLENVYKNTSHVISDYTAIIEAAKKDDVGLIKLILERSKIKLNLNMFDEYGYNALLYAIDYKSKKVIEFLLENGANIDVSTTQKQPVFKFAIDNDDLPLFIKHAEKYSSGIDISDLLHYAIACKANNAVECLINIDSITPNIIQRAINNAIQVENIDILKMLLTKNENDVLNTTYEQAWLPLERAVIMSNIEAVELLLEAGSDINNWIEEPLIMQACSRGRDIKILQMLLGSKGKIEGISLESLNYSQYGFNILGYSLFEGNYEATKLLLEFGFDPNKNSQQGTALNVASNTYSIYNSIEEKFSLLVKHRASTYNSSLSQASLIEQYFEKKKLPLNDLATSLEQTIDSVTLAIPEDVSTTTYLTGDVEMLDVSDA